jgi:DNA (cytosine-5)-methyltransferase 1
VNHLSVDNFAGGGGASLGMERALGRPVSIAVNHDENAILMHRANHPATTHYCENVWAVDPVVACGGAPVEIAWFSPDCKDFSKAKGGRPVSKRVRGLAWVVLRWAARARPRVIVLENVEEFAGWGPLTRSGRRCPRRRGLTFERWVSQLQDLGYRVEWRELRACDYGAPTIRKRLFVVARRDGRPIVWPAPSHGPGLIPYRTAAECIDFSLPCPSIFERKRPLAAATQRRIARGIQRYVIEAAEPFVIRTDMHKSNAGCVYGLGDPLRTITSTGGHALVLPTLVKNNFGSKPCQGVQEPLHTITTQANRFALVASTLIQTGYGERPGQAPRVPGLGKPLGTVVAGGAKHALVTAFLAQHNGGMVGHDLRKPLSTVTQRGTQQQVVTSHLIKLRGTCRHGQAVTEPMPTITAGGMHLGEVRAFLIKYFGDGGQLQDLRDPLHTATTKARFGVVTVEIGGTPYVIADIGMRMLTPRELFTAQGFPGSYEIAPLKDGAPLTKTAQIEKCGNSVSPQVAEAVVRANLVAKADAEDVA